MTDIEKGMFKQYDIRIKSTKLTDESKVRLCNSVVVYYRDTVKATSIVIGRDARLFAPELVECLVDCFRKAGIEVFLNPLPISTCQFYFSCMQHRESAGIMVTASHNPGEYIGLKLMAPELFPIAFGHGPEGGIEKIMALYEQDAKVKTSLNAKLTVINYMDKYIDFCMKLANVKEGSLKGIKILLEFLNGSVGTEVALAFQKAGADIECRNIIPNGLFPKGDPNPVVEASIAPAREEMKKGNFDIGFCFDGDGDRLDLMGPDGRQIVPGLNMSVIIGKTMEIFKGKMKSFYADVRSMPVSLWEMRRNNADVHLIRNGHSFIKGKLRDNSNKGYFGSVEESAHYYLNFPYDENDLSKGYAAIEATLFFALLSARCYMENPSSYQRAFKLQDSMFREREWPLYCEMTSEKMEGLMAEVEQKMTSLGAKIIKTMDDGSDIDATLMRFNVPENYDPLDEKEKITWAQIAQRISRSEDSICRFEVVSNSKQECDRLNNEIKKITDKYVNEGLAKY